MVACRHLPKGRITGLWSAATHRGQFETHSRLAELERGLMEHRFPFLIGILALVACGGDLASGTSSGGANAAGNGGNGSGSQSASSTAGSGGGAGIGITVSVAPKSTTVIAGKSLGLTATVTGTQDAAVIW